MRFAVVFLALLAAAFGSSFPLQFNVSSSGTIGAGSVINYSLSNTLEADGSQTAFYVMFSCSATCVIQSTIGNLAPSVEPYAINTTFPGDYPIFFFTPYPTYGASLNWTVSLQGIESSCTYTLEARNMPAQPISFGQTFVYENTDPWGFVRFTTQPKDAGKPFPAFMAALGVTTYGSEDITGCAVATESDPSVGGNGEDWWVADRSIGYSGQWGIYDDTPRTFVQAVTGFFPSGSVPLSFYARAMVNGSVPCPKWNITLNSIPATPLKVGQSALTLSYTSADTFAPALIFGPAGASSYSLVVSFVSGGSCYVGWAGNDPATFSGNGQFQVIGDALLNSTSPTATVPVSGASAPTYVWAAYLNSPSEGCVISVAFA